MTRTLRTLALLLAIGTVTGAAAAAPAPQDRSYHDGYRHHDSGWERRDEQRQREREHWQRDRAWQRQQEAELRRRADWQRERDYAWQRQQEAELRRRAEYQRRNTWDYPSRYGQHYDDYRSNRWERGHHYHGPRYVVRDYGHYHLRQPPRGYHWVQADGKYLLIAAATGLILDIASR